MNTTPASQKIDIQAFIEEAVALLRENMESHSSFDSDRPYDEKNAYFIELARRGQDHLFLPGLHWVAELYFITLLTEILKYEKSHDKHFNKGMVYADLGIAQMAIGKFDAGIANLLAADEEDRPFVNDPHGILNSPLWKQFEQPVIVEYLIRFNQNSDAALKFSVDEAFLNNFFVNMDLQDCLFFEGTIWALIDNLRRDHSVPNVYTRGRLFSGLKDLCLLTEALLRKKQVIAGTLQSDAYITLPKLIENALSNQSSNLTQNLNTNANNLKEFVDNLENILSNASSPEIRRVYCLRLVRNFTGHHFDLSHSIVSPNGQSFFDMYETTLTNILSAILYFKHINVI
jgi:hypothetical protein